MSSFPSTSLPSIPMPIPSVSMPTTRSSSSGGSSLGFSMGSGIPSTSTIPMSGLTLSSVGLPFGWNIPSGFGAVPSQAGGSNTSGGFNFPWVSTPFPRGTSLGGNFHNGEAIPLSIPPVLGGSSLGLVLGTHFLLGLHLPLGEIPLGHV
jgi:hypothetical protein